MSLPIKGMDMPRCCKECGLLIDEDFSCDSSPHYCAVNQYLRWRDWSEVPEYISAGCLLIEIPIPHGDLIDREVLLNEYKADPKEEKAMMNENLAAYLMMDEIVEKVVENIKSIPTIIEAEQGDG